MVLDHARYRLRLPFAVADPQLFREVCTDSFSPLLFEAADADGVPAYHTNVLMSGTRWRWRGCR